MKNKLTDFLSTKAGFFLISASIWLVLMIFFDYLDYKLGENYFHDFLVEANGMFFDLLVFGIVVSIYEARQDKKEKKGRAEREKNEKIERLREEIDDYRRWNDKEAMYRIAGAIKRLNIAGATAGNLKNCCLSGMRLRNADMSKADHRNADMSKADLISTNMSESNFMQANLSSSILTAVNLSKANLLLTNLSYSRLSGANLSEAVFTFANLTNTDLSGSNLQNAILSGVELIKTNLVGADMVGAKIKGDWFEKLEEWEVVGREEIIEKYKIDENGKLQFK